MERNLFHVIQRGERKQPVFFDEQDYEAYLDLVSQLCSEADVSVWAYSLLPNHIHMLLATDTAAEVRRTIGRANHLYKRRINFRTGLNQRLWQEQMLVFPLREDARLLTAAARYIEREPLDLGLAAQVMAYPWTSAQAHVEGQRDGLVDVAPLRELVPDWEGFLAEGGSCGLAKRFRSQERRAGMFQVFRPSVLVAKLFRRAPALRVFETGPR